MPELHEAHGPAPEGLRQAAIRHVKLRRELVDLHLGGTLHPITASDKPICPYQAGKYGEKCVILSLVVWL